MKTDTELKRDVEAELAWDPAINAAAVGVAVSQGVVTLSGHLDTYAEKAAIAKVLQRVAGVKAIALELDVRLSPEHRRSDTDIATAIQSALAWNTVVPPDRVRATVDKGWVTLTGELEWDFQRKSVEKTVRPMIGVVGISNQVALRPRVAPADVRERIGDALKRHAEREANHIEVRVDGARVTLKGKVSSWAESTVARGAAWAAPGVREVVSDLELG